MSLEEFAIKPQQLESGLKMLKARQRNLMLLGVASAVLMTSSAAALYVQQDFVYGFFGLTLNTEQLHLPSSADAAFAFLGQQKDYFFSLFAWFGWLFLKLFCSFFGAFIAVHILKKIHFFYVRFQSFVLKFVGWLLSFLLIWGGLTYVQHDTSADQGKEYQQLVHYDQRIQESEIAQILAQEPMAKPVKDYLLAQTALLHKPADKAAAIPHVQALMQAEQYDPNFFSYGFKPEQMWTLQHQLFEKSLTPMAKSVNKQVLQAKRLNQAVRWVLLFALALTALMCLFLFTAASRIKQRVQRIEQHIY